MALIQAFPDFQVGDVVKYTAKYRQTIGAFDQNALPASGAVVSVDSKPMNKTTNLKVVKVLWEGALEPKGCLNSTIMLVDQADLTGL
jgi:hypothetical protein